MSIGGGSGRGPSVKKMRHHSKIEHRRISKQQDEELIHDFADLFSESQLRRNYLWYYYEPELRRVRALDEATRDDLTLLRKLIARIPNGFGDFDDLVEEAENDGFVGIDEG